MHLFFCMHKTVSLRFFGSAFALGAGFGAVLFLPFALPLFWPLPPFAPLPLPPLVLVLVGGGSVCVVST